jgi:hypothetical protein
MKGKIAAACSAVAMATFGSIGLAAPAHAATYVDFCFVFEDGSPWAGRPTAVHAAANGGWIQVGAIISDERGCAAYKVSGYPTTVPIHGYAYQAAPDPFGGVAYYWEGITNNAPAGDGEVQLGTYTVVCKPNTILCP